MIEPLIFALHGLLGAFLYISVWKVKEKYEILRHSIVGAGMGYFFFLLHTQYTFPNVIMAIVFGYFGIDIAERVFEVLRPLKREEGEE